MVSNGTFFSGGEGGKSPTGVVEIPLDNVHQPDAGENLEEFLTYHLQVLSEPLYSL